MNIVSKPNINYGIWASNGDIAVPSSEKVEIGHIIEKPAKEIVNWIENRQDQFIAYLNQRGIPEWDNATTYPVEVSFVNRGGTVYKALSQNTDKDPTLNQDIWEIAWAKYDDFSNLETILNRIETEEGYLSLYVSKTNPELSVDIAGVGYKNTDKTKGLAFVDDEPSIVSGDSVVVTFSGGDSPKDVVTHEQLQELLKIRIGDLYTTTVNENPATRLGYGEWERFAEGKTLVGFSGSVSNDIPEWVKTMGSEYGEYNHLQTVEELASHDHTVGQIGSRYNFPESYDVIGNADGVTSDNIPDPLAYRGTTKTGGSKPFNVVQPSKVVFIWRRVS